jgi:exodeoxyribonuclease VII large subunit
MKREPFNPDLMPRRANEHGSAFAGPLTVSQLTGLIKRAIQDALPATVHVVGEISNFKRHAGGHLYCTLKDGGSELACVMWRADAAKLKFAPENGLEVIATGGVEVFERAGRYQLYIRRLEPRGVGALELAFRQLCTKLEKEGLFDPQRKKPLPRFPRRIVLVTSPTGAAVTDMIRTIERRFPCVQMLVYPVRVQGSGAAAEIATAIRLVNSDAERLGGVDLMIVGRGGGSLEDLWAFNEEIVARAIFASRIPIISAVGHEVDVTIADLAADVRAATPTAAGEIAVPVLYDLLAGLGAQELRLAHGVGAKAELAAAKLAGLLRRTPFRDPFTLLLRRVQIVDEWTHRTHRLLARRLHTARAGVDRCEPIVQRIAPHAFLLRTSARLARAEQSFHMAVTRKGAAAEQKVGHAVQRLERVSPARMLPAISQRIEHLDEALDGALRRRFSVSASRLQSQEALLNAVGHKSVLARGYSITRTKQGRHLVRRVGELRDRQRIVTQLADGEFESETINIRQMELFDEA